MASTTIRRSGAIVIVATLLASLAVMPTAASAAAAKPRCAGKVATIVGTKQGEIIQGTAKADVIVARGGHDKIYGRGGNDTICAGLGHDTVFGGPGIDRIFGQPGRDRLYGGPGPDFLAGQLDDDTLNGGIGVDTCFQGPGAGLVASCERPVPGPTPISMAGVFAIAYSDIDGLPGYSTGDVLISMLVDANGDGVVGAGDRVEMGRYPLTYDPSGPGDFGDWGVRNHAVVRGGWSTDASGVTVVAGPGENLFFDWRAGSPIRPAQEYVERGPETSHLLDGLQPPTWGDFIAIQRYSPSYPGVLHHPPFQAGAGDDPFLDVDVFP